MESNLGDSSDPSHNGVQEGTQLLAGAGDGSVAITAENLGKTYKIYPTPGARVAEALHPLRKSLHTDFNALQDVSFSVTPGQTFGIIGRNGSGKSTLLQLIAGVLTPTSGRVNCKGRIAALLELGAGFNPSFTGRENVIINGAVMGFSRQEMVDRLPEILAFSELGDFIDQPVKTYSSGMYVRLAFAAAINVDPEILIVDEALAVGDTRFQNKCYRKFEQFRKAGKTILLVTHDGGAVVRYCDQALLLEQGKMLMLGQAGAVVNRYSQLLPTVAHAGRTDTPKPKAKAQARTASAGNPSAAAGQPADGAAVDDCSVSSLSIEERFLREPCMGDMLPAKSGYNPHEHRYGDKGAEIVDCLAVCGDKADPATMPSQSEVDFLVKVRFNRDVENPIYGLTLKNANGLTIYGINSLQHGAAVQPRLAGETTVMRFRMRLPLIDGNYFLNLGVVERFGGGEAEPLDRRYDVIHIQVTPVGKAFGLVDLKADFGEVG